MDSRYIAYKIQSAKTRDISRYASVMSLDRGYENNLKSAGGYQFVIGIDEAGRGPLAGPVVAAACLVPMDVSFEGIVDSKATKEADREDIFNALTTHPRVKWGVSIVSNDEIDSINILQASLTAMSRATVDLLSKCEASSSEESAEDERIETRHCLALVDGIMIQHRITLSLFVLSLSLFTLSLFK